MICGGRANRNAPPGGRLKTGTACGADLQVQVQVFINTGYR
jgi:hypothetical protein